MGIIEIVKRDLRIKHEELNESIKENVNACKMDLSIAGVQNTDDNDSLILQEIKLYNRWQFDYMGRGETFREAYECLKIALALCGDYNGGEHEERNHYVNHDHCKRH